MKKIIITTNIIITILLLTNFSYGQDSIVKTNKNMFNKSILQIKNKIRTLENIRQEIINGDLNETRKAQIKEELYYYIEQAFYLINDPSKKRLLTYSQNIIAKLLPEETVSIVNDFITIAKLNLTTEEKIELFYSTNNSSGYATCYSVFVNGFYILVIALLLAIIGITLFGTTIGFALLMLSLYMVAIGLAIAAIGLICMLLSL
jgi:HAMP domain-containing protein